MIEYVTLMGAEEVSRAGSAMRSAAAEIHFAASTISESVQRLAGLMDRFEVAVTSLVEAIEEQAKREET